MYKHHFVFFFLVCKGVPPRQARESFTSYSHREVFLTGVAMKMQEVEVVKMDEFK